MRRNKNKKIIILSLIGILLLMSAGYAAFRTNLDIKGTSKVSSNWDIRITNVTESNKGGDAESAKEPTWEALTASVEANLYQKGDFIEYDVTVENRGTLDAKLEGIEEKIIGENEAIKLTISGYTKGEKLYKNTSKKIKVKIEYNLEFNGVPEIGSTEISIDLNYTQNDDYSEGEDGEIISPDRYLVAYDCTSNGGNKCTNYNEYLKEGETVNLLHQGTNNNHKFIGWNTNKDAEEGLTELQMGSEDITLYAIYEKDPIIRSWTSTDTTDFHSEAYKQSIISAEFLDNKNIPENAVESWDVSEKKDKSVMAWVIPDNTDNTKHHLYIGGNGGVIANQDSSNLFKNFVNIKDIDFNNNFDTSKATTFNTMFANCRELIRLDLSTLDTNNVTDMENMFVSTAAVSPMKIKSIKFGGKFVTNKVTNMNAMFGNCGSLVTLDLSSFNTNKVVDMREMFSGCTNLETLNLNNWETLNLTTIQAMFYNCKNLIKLNLCTFNTKTVTDAKIIFTGTNKLSKVYVGPNWDLTNADITNMFNGSGISSVTKSNNCMVDAEDPATLSFTTTKTTKSITVVATATSESGIAKYEYSKDGGSTWVTGNGNTYTFDGLKSNTAYNIKVRVTSKIGKQTTSETSTVTTNTIATPTFSDNTNQTQITITYPEGCGSKYTCTYKYNDGSEVTTTNSSTIITKNATGNIVAKVTDGTNTVSSSYIVLYNNVYISNSGNDNTGYGTKEKPYATLLKAHSMATKTATIHVMNGSTLSLTSAFKPSSNKNITIQSYGSTSIIKKAAALSEFLIVVNNGSLTLNNIVLDGNGISDDKGGVYAAGGVTLNINSGTTIRNFKSTGPGGGGGIYCTTDSTLNISGGTINSNTAYIGGGIWFGGKTMNLTGGTIKENTATYNGGGMEIYNGTMIFDGVTIDSNTANNVGGGIHAGSGTTTIKNATITNNKALNGDGGGLRTTGTAVVNIVNAKISGNTSKSVGGGIFVYSNSKVTMNGGEVSNNSATNNGGGIGVTGENNHTATFILNGGSVKNNTATTANGGIYRYGTATYTYKSGIVCGNRPTNSYERSTNC